MNTDRHRWAAAEGREGLLRRTGRRCAGVNSADRVACGLDHQRVGVKQAWLQRRDHRLGCRPVIPEPRNGGYAKLMRRIRGDVQNGRNGVRPQAQEALYGAAGYLGGGVVGEAAQLWNCGGRFRTKCGEYDRDGAVLIETSIEDRHHPVPGVGGNREAGYRAPGAGLPGRLLPTHPAEKRGNRLGSNCPQGLLGLHTPRGWGKLFPRSPAPVHVYVGCPVGQSLAAIRRLGLADRQADTQGSREDGAAEDICVCPAPHAPIVQESLPSFKTEPSIGFT